MSETVTSFSPRGIDIKDFFLKLKAFLFSQVTELDHSLYYLPTKNDPAQTDLIEVGGYIAIDSFGSGAHLLVSNLYHVYSHKNLGKKFKSIFANEFLPLRI